MSAFEDFRAELGPPEAVPRPKAGLNLSELSIDPQEGLVLSRVDGASTLRDLCIICGLGDEQTLTILIRLKDRGLITLPGVRTRPDLRSNTAKLRDRKAKAQRDPDRATLEEMRAWAAFPFDAEALRAKAALSEVRRKRILYAYQRLDQQTYYELLGVDPEADASGVRRAYYRATKRFHPDRYFRKDIGPFRDFLSEIFKQLGKAYDVLSDGEMRRKYDLLLSHRAAAAGSAGGGATDRAQEAYDRGVRKYESGDLAGALEDFRLAEALEPKDQKYRDMVRRTFRAVQRQRGQEAARRGREAEKAGDLLAARDAFVEAATCSATPEHLERAALSLSMVGGDLDQALGFARLAVQLAQDQPGVHRTLAVVFERMGELAEARVALARAVALAPDDEQLLARLHKLDRQAASQDNGGAPQG